MDFINDEEELLISFEKDTVEDVHFPGNEDLSFINITVTPNLSELEAFIDKEYDEDVNGRTTTAYSQRTHLQLANVLLFMALLIILKLVLVVLNQS